MDTLEFYDIETNKKFLSSDYKIIEKGGRKFAVAKSPDNSHDCWIVLKSEEPKKE